MSYVHECSTEIEKRVVYDRMILLINEFLVPVVIETYKTFVRLEVPNLPLLFARNNCLVSVKEVFTTTMAKLKEHLVAPVPTQVGRLTDDIISQMSYRVSRELMFAQCELLAITLLYDIELSPERIATNAITREYILKQIEILAKVRQDFIHKCYEQVEEINKLEIVFV